MFYGGLKAGEVNPDHTHDWDARVMVIGGEITLTRGGRAETFNTGGSCAVSAGEVHAEHVGPQGVAFIAGRRATAAYRLEVGDAVKLAAPSQSQRQG